MDEGEDPQTLEFEGFRTSPSRGYGVSLGYTIVVRNYTPLSVRPLRHLDIVVLGDYEDMDATGAKYSVIRDTGV